MVDEPSRDPRRFLVDGALDIESYLSAMSDDVVYDWSRSPFPDAGIYHGIDGVRDWYRGLSGAFGEMRYEVERVQEAGERVAFLARAHGLGPSSQIPVDYTFAVVTTVRAGKIVRVDRYDDWAAATAGLGLPE